MARAPVREVGREAEPLRERQRSRVLRVAGKASDEERALRLALEEREEVALLLEGLLEALADGVVALDSRGEVVHVSPSLSAREPGRPGSGAGTSGARAMGEEETGGEALPREVLERLRREACAIKPGETRRFDLDWDRPETGTRRYRVAGACGCSASLGLTLFTFRDHTLELSLEAELSRARQLAALGQMAATVAHELRNPLGAIQGFATLLRRDLAGQEDLLRQVDRILRGVERAERIVSDLLQYCRPLEPRLDTVPLTELLAASAADLRASPRWRPGIDLDIQTDAGLPPCLGDRRLLLQVLGNLYDNAVDAMREGGSLTVRARAAGPSDRPDRLRIIVRDSGCGLSAEEVAMVFAPFYTTKPGGTGLGLALVRRIVEAHGGHVHVVSAPQRGTSVVLDLPAAAEALLRGPERERELEWEAA